MYRLLNFFESFQNFIFGIFAYILLWLAPIKNYVHLVLILIFIDLVTGSYASVKQGENFSARKLRNTLEKFIFYAIAIISGYVLQRIIDDGVQLARIVALYIGATEVKSIYENISRITKIDIVAIVWETLKEKMDEYVQILRSKKTKP